MNAPSEKMDSDNGEALTPEDDLRLNQLMAVLRAQVTRLIRIRRRSNVTLVVRVEARPRMHLSRDSKVTVEEFPLVGGGQGDQRQ